MEYKSSKELETFRPAQRYKVTIEECHCKYTAGAELFHWLRSCNEKIYAYF